MQGKKTTDTAGQNRAVQFAPIDALTGYTALLEKSQEKPEPRRILSPEAAEVLSARLSQLKRGDRILLRYYDGRLRKYRNLGGQVREVDFVFRTLKVERFVIPFSAVEALRFRQNGGISS